MKKLRTMICVLLVLCIAACTLSGCHGSKGLPVFEIPESFDPNQHHEITFWAKSDTNVKQTRVYEKAIADFEALYPNIKVTLRIYTDYSRIYNDVITNIPTNTTPNVCITYPDHIATYKTGVNSVVPLDALFANEKYGLGGSELRYEGPNREEMVEQFMQECLIDGEYYAMPYMRSTEACYINKTMVESMGYTVPDELTWDFVWEVAEAAARKDEEGTYYVNGQKTMIPFIYKSTDNMMIQMLRQLEAPYSNEQGDILIFHDTTKKLLFDIAEHVKSGAFSTFKISSYPANFLNAGQCIFAVDSTAGATWMGSHAPLSDIAEDKVVEFETVVRSVPQFDPENPQMISQGPSVCIFNKTDSQEVLASWLFAQYLLTQEVQLGYAMTEGYLPVTHKVQNSEAYQDYISRCGEDDDTYYDIKIQASRLLMDHVDDTFVTPVFNGSASLRDTAGQMIENVAKSTNRKQTVDDAYIEKLYEDMNALYRLDQRDAGTVKKEDLGPLPGTAKALLICLVSAWILMGLYAGLSWIHKKNLSKKV